MVSCFWCQPAQGETLRTSLIILVTVVIIIIIMTMTIIVIIFIMVFIGIHSDQQVASWS